MAAAATDSLALHGIILEQDVGCDSLEVAKLSSSEIEGEKR